MVQALAITNNIRFSKKLINEIRTRHLTINIVALSTTKLETNEVLKGFTPDIIIFDSKMIKFYNVEFFKKYKNIIIELSYCLNGNLFSIDSLNRISNITKNSDFERCKRKVIKELEYIGYNFKYKGSHYISDTILELLGQNPDIMADNLQTDIYPIIAKKYNKTVYNVKSSIGKATDYMYCTCDADKLVRYFHLSYDAKPTPKQVVFTVINKILR